MIRCRVIPVFFAGCCLLATAQVSADEKPSSPNAATALPAPPKDGPMWSELTDDQRTAMKPLAAEWNSLEPSRKKKWLEISERFHSMKPDEQTRLQDRMREWAKLSPEQRETARETYRKAQKLPPQKKRAQWEKYQTLPEERKNQLKSEAAQKKRAPDSDAAVQATPPKP